MWTTQGKGKRKNEGDLDTYLNPVLLYGGRHAATLTSGRGAGSRDLYKHR